MALAYLCTKIRPTDQWFKVADHPVSNPIGIIVDHGLREGSAAEAANVSQALKKIGVKPNITRLRWADVVEPGVNPSDLPNVETLARYLRYRRLGTFCKVWQVATLLTAHHEDDQYETVLMRLLSGHGYRGLQGMRPATDIPECYDLHGVYQSGFVDDQRRENPFYNLRPSEKERKQLKRGLRDEIDPAVIAREVERGLRSDIGTAYLEDYDGIAKGKPAPPLVPLEIEDGGIMVYRPLLRFGKDRLIATCLENSIPWFDDHTNADQTLTLRNAVRHMIKHHKLPEALQKPSILRLAERCRARVASAEAEAGRLLRRVRIHEFGQNAGTLVVTLPRFYFPTVPRRLSASPASRRRRTEHYRHIAALMVRRLLSMVTPERELSQPGQLGHLVSMLFPSLADGTPPPEPKAYVICGVHFVPLIGDYPLRWLLARAPHVSNVPRPSVTFHELPFGRRMDKHPRGWKTQGWTEPRMFDGRYWIRVLHRLPCKLRVAPFEMEHHKPFREALADDQARKELASMLRRYAPGKVRYTLPAIYATLDVTDLLAGGDWWPPHLLLGPPSQRAAAAHSEEQPEPDSEQADQPDPEPEPLNEPPPPRDETEAIQQIRSRKLSALHAGRLEWERRLQSAAAHSTPPQLQLLALPTLGVGLPGLEDWLRWEVRYRKVDDEVLRLSRRGGRRVGRRELRARVRFWYRWMRLGWGRKAARGRAVGVRRGRGGAVKAGGFR
jgi:tRNA(Ile)-lysidine synthase TilS/MesJ